MDARGVGGHLRVDSLGRKRSMIQMFVLLTQDLWKAEQMWQSVLEQPSIAMLQTFPRSWHSSCVVF